MFQSTFYTLYDLASAFICKYANLDLYYKSRHNSTLSVTINYTRKRRSLMAANNHTKYDEDFKKSLASLHQNGKTQAQLCKEYGVFQSALGKWVKQYSTVKIDDGEVLTAKQVKRKSPCGLMFHSDQGTQYTAFSFRQLLDSLNVVQSFSKKGCPLDNACCECFFKFFNTYTFHLQTGISFCCITTKKSPATF